MKLRALAIAVMTLALTSAAASPGFGAPVFDSGRVPAVVSFVGDFNITLGSTQIAIAFTRRNAPYAIVDLARSGAAIRSPDCPWLAWVATPCPTHNFWRTRLAEANAKIATDAYVVDLGFNDTAAPGTPTSRGYAGYPAKIDWMMHLFGGKPVLWTNLPCAIEPPARKVGCTIVDASLAAATRRWPNLTLVNWAAVANAHTEYMSPLFGGGLYTSAGATAWASTVVAAADRTLAARSHPASRPAAARVTVPTKRGADRVPAAVTLVGDSNITLGSTQIAIALTQRDSPYAVVDLARGSTTIRTSDCPLGVLTCPTYNFWRTRLVEANARIATDAYVVDLGINDTEGPGTPTGRGYAGYPAKIDWMMHLFGGKPVFWTNLPCAIEPPARKVGCTVVNASLAAATRRWPNLRVINWAAVADSHRGYMAAGDIHYVTAGDLAWATTVASALDTTFRQPTPTFLAR
jgi:hypothetical protein